MAVTKPSCIGAPFTLATQAGEPVGGAATFRPGFRAAVGRAEHHTARLGRSGVTGQADPGCAADHEHVIQAAAPPAETLVRGSLAPWMRRSLNYSSSVQTALFGHASLRPLLLVAARKHSRSNVGTAPFSRGSETLAARKNSPGIMGTPPFSRGPRKVASHGHNL